MTVISKGSFPADKYYSDFDESDTENYRIVEESGCPGNRNYSIYIRGREGSSPVVRIRLEGSGRWLDEKHDSYRAHFSTTGTGYDVEGAGYLSEALAEAKMLVETLLDDDCAALRARDAAYVAEERVKNELREREREARLEATEEVGMKEAKAMVSAQIKALKADAEYGTCAKAVWVTMGERVSGRVRQGSIEIFNGKCVVSFEGSPTNRGWLTERIAESDAAKLRFETVAVSEV